MAADLESIGAVLMDRANELGVTIRHGLGVSSVDATDHVVTVRAGEETFRGGWLVCCDGGRSIVRKAAGFGFDRRDAPERAPSTGTVLLLDGDKSDSLRTLADRYRGRVTYLPCNARDLSGLQALLVRADGFVAWQAIDVRTALRRPELYRNG